jgi:hypothetical protein
MGRGGRRLAAHAQRAGGNELSPQPRGRLEGHQREKHRLGGQAARQLDHGFCAYHWEESKSEFICPCHNSVFGADGRVISGPAPRPLDRYQAKVEGGHLLLGPLEKPEPTA